MVTESFIYKVAHDRHSNILANRKFLSDETWYPFESIDYFEIEQQVREEFKYGMKAVPKETEMSPVIRDIERLKEIQLQAVKGAEEAKQIAEKYKKPLFKIFS